jgi:hypothetical protein
VKVKERPITEPLKNIILHLLGDDLFDLIDELIGGYIAAESVSCVIPDEINLSLDGFPIAAVGFHRLTLYFFFGA